MSLTQTPPQPGRAAWGVLASTAAVRILQRMLASGRVPHAVLMSGPPQVGKRDLALRLAQALNCEDDAAPCGACRPCRRIQDGHHADVEVVGPSALCKVSDHDHAQSRVIGICQIRRLEAVSFTQPYEGRRRVFIVDPADALTREAADAFLKTLEEPPPAVHFVLISSAPETLSETVRSRCRRLEVAPLPSALLAEWLVDDAGIEPERSQALARMARGRAGWATGALKSGDDPLEVRAAQVDEILRLAAAPRGERLAVAERLAGRSSDAANVLVVLQVWLEWWRDLLLTRTHARDGVLHVDQQELLNEEAAMYRPADLCRFLAELQRAVERVGRGVNSRLTLEALFLTIPRRRLAARTGAA